MEQSAHPSAFDSATSDSGRRGFDATAEIVFSANNLVTNAIEHPTSFFIRRGEVITVFGCEGSGIRDLLSLFSGQDAGASGSLYIKSGSREVRFALGSLQGWAHMAANRYRRRLYALDKPSVKATRRDPSKDVFSGCDIRLLDLTSGEACPHTRAGEARALAASGYAVVAVTYDYQDVIAMPGRVIVVGQDRVRGFVPRAAVASDTLQSLLC
ncbi:hypothetical protein [Asticcacaulis sp. W401b]|uniref:hypothetical protein n=1 Tax=Asticcacaulis sp. W401b TaxID=3388666 RepID=UPI003970B9DD